MTTRRQFLATIAARLEEGLPVNPIRPLRDVPDQPLEYSVDLSDPVTSFVAAASAVEAEIVETTTAQLPTMVLDLVRELGEDPLVATTDEPLCEPITEHLEANGVRIAGDHAPATLAGAALGISGVRIGIGLTGSVVVDSSVPGARTVSLLPDVHLAVLRVANIVPDPGSFLRTLNSDDLPSNLVFITGPSRSADIELQLTIGVHGPGRLVVALI